MNDQITTKADIAGVIDAAYELLAFKPGSQPQWADFGALFVERTVLALRVFPTDEAISVLSLPDYMEAQMQHGLKEEGYSETPGDRVITIYGDVATVRQDFTMNFARRSPVPAVDVFSLVRVDGRWMIVSVISDLADSSGAV